MDFISIPDTLTMLVSLVYGLACPSLGLVVTLVFQMHLDLFGCFAYLHFILVLKWMNGCWDQDRHISSTWKRPHHWSDFNWPENWSSIKFYLSVENKFIFEYKYFSLITYKLQWENLDGLGCRIFQQWENPTRHLIGLFPPSRGPMSQTSHPCPHAVSSIFQKRKHVFVQNQITCWKGFEETLAQLSS